MKSFKKYYFVILLLLSERAYSQDCPLTKEYYKYNTGWLVADTTEYIFSTGRKDTLQNKFFKKGAGLIFQYSAFYDCPQIYDEEKTDILTWSIPDSSSTFEIIFTENDFRSLPFSYKLAQFGYNRPKGLISVTGRISGEKKNGNYWSIIGALVVIAGDRVGTFQINRKIAFSKEFAQIVYSGPRGKKKYADNYPFYYEK